MKDIESQVCEDIKARQQIGILKYGCTVANNPLPLREWLEHAYQESLDLPIYLKKAICDCDQERIEAARKAYTFGDELVTVGECVKCGTLSVWGGIMNDAKTCWCSKCNMETGCTMHPPTPKDSDVKLCH